MIDKELTPAQLAIVDKCDRDLSQLDSEKVKDHVFHALRVGTAELARLRLMWPEYRERSKAGRITLKPRATEEFARLIDSFIDVIGHFQLADEFKKGGDA